MNSEHYDRLLDRIRHARDAVAYSMESLKVDQDKLDTLLSELDQEESRIAREALASIHSASRKLVVGE